ncbi:hypothetical protein [Nannocystis sp.]|uniref:hypothetical protein n=1 Tax=Nannocystis sp. TaxID=1962667 RepID=UPI002421DFB3|nr:hypothetical protein [Nannocystis sp.]MBK7826066.1 hypothetical protein [Nannocystis sp.]MBK9755397.1 hypothetical protein [Nannocystis sp.]
MTRSTGLLGLLFAAGVTFGACTGPYGDSDSDTASSSTGGECPVGSLNCLCTTGKSCDSGLVCASDRCVKLDGDTSTSDASTSLDPTTGDPSTGGGDCDANGDGSVDPACPESQPYCVAGACFGCAQLDCEALSPAQPLCNEASGLCVACLCTDAKPVCDPDTHSCRVCTAHSDCPDSACDLWTGACFPAAATLWVEDGGECSDAGPGDASAPLCSLDAAFERINAAGPGHQAVRVRPGSYTVKSPLRAPADHVVALVHATGQTGDPTVTIAAKSSAAIAIDPGAKLLVDALRLTDSGGDALECTNGTALLDRLTVTASNQRGVMAEGCELVLRRGVLFGNAVAGARLNGGKLRLENTYFSGNGNPQTGEGGIYLADGAALDAVYSTWVDNRGQAGTPYAVACSDDNPKEKVGVRNSLAINIGFNTLCDGASVAHTGWSTDMVAGSNMAIASADLGKYLKVDPDLPGVYRVIVGAGLDKLGAWEQGDPAIDFDGDARPNTADAPDFAGADRVAR